MGGRLASSEAGLLGSGGLGWGSCCSCCCSAVVVVCGLEVTGETPPREGDWGMERREAMVALATEVVATEGEGDDEVGVKARCAAPGGGGGGC